MERTRDELVRLLHERGARSVPELARELALSEGSVRRHMDILLAERVVETSLDRRHRGRPAVRYTLNEAGEERSASAYYSRLLDRMYPALASLSEEAVSGRSGSELLELVFTRVAEDVARKHAPRVRGDALAERVGAVTDLLSEEGILNDVVDEGEVYRLRNIGCPYRLTAEGTPEACGADRRTIELLLGESVEQLSTIVDGALTCEYIVRKPPRGRLEGRAAG